MACYIIIQDEAEAEQIVAWGVRFARAVDAPLTLLHVVQRDAGELSGSPSLSKESNDPEHGTLVNAVRRAVDASPGTCLAPREADEEGSGSLKTESCAAEAVPVSLEILAHPRPVDAVLGRASAPGDLLVLPRHAPLSQAGDDALAQRDKEIFRRATCATVVLRPGVHPGDRCASILVPVEATRHSRHALRFAHRLTSDDGGKITALWVEPDIGVDAEAVGHRILDRLLREALGDDASRVSRRVVVARETGQGVAQTYESEDDLVLMGARETGAVRRILFGALPESAVQAPDGPGLAVYRAPAAVPSRVGQAVVQWITTRVPQLQRSDRVALVERVQSSSTWDTDFVVLMTLATLIASLGLVHDSGAVVIGAMLVAPLMTPLVGMGLALLQGNPVLFRRASSAALRGIVYAVSLAFIAGILLAVTWSPFSKPTGEMLDRTAPDVLDLFVAAASGFAAAYANARPGLSAALPGVAIAAALVPPLSTVGLSLAIGEWRASGGAALLFVTNLVMIVWAASFALWMVGIRGAHEHGRFRFWSAVGTAIVVALVIVLAVVLTVWPWGPAE